MKVNQKRVIKMLNKKNNIYRKVREANGCYYATDAYYLVKFPAEMCDLTEYEATPADKIPSADAMEKFFRETGNNARHLVQVTKKELNDYMQDYGKEAPMEIGGGCYIDPGKLKEIVLMFEVDEAVLHVEAPQKNIYMRIGEAEIVLAPIRVTATAYDKMEKYIINRDFSVIKEVLSVNDNEQSIKAFSKITGVALSPTKARRLEQVASYFGTAWEAWEYEQEQEHKEKAVKAKEKEQAIKSEKVRTALEDYKAGKWIDNEAFILLCDEYSIKMHIRTRGYCKNTLMELKKNGHYKRNKQGKSQGFFDAWNALNKAMEAA